MLIALLTMLLLGGGGGEGLEVFGKKDHKLAQDVVADEERAAAVVAEMKAAQKRFDQSTKETRGLIKRWRKTDADADAGRAELESMLREAEENRSEAVGIFADAIFAMRQEVTAEEWAAYRQGLEDEG
jgi:alkylhydroperoxidase family enzyme